jgi:hypothetical protein
MKNQNQTKERVEQAAEIVLNNQGYVCPIDVLVQMRLLDPVHVQEWKQGKIPYLEDAIYCNADKFVFAMQCFNAWSWLSEKGLEPREIVYYGMTRDQRALQFTENGGADYERFFRIHYFSPSLTEKEKENLRDKLEELPELVVFLVVKDSQCSQCCEELPRESFLFMEGQTPLCLCCAGLDQLVFLPSGDPLLTRRAKKHSVKSAVVLKFGRSRGRYERQGLLVEEEALQHAEVEAENKNSRVRKC